VSFHDAYSYLSKQNPSGLSTFNNAYKTITGRLPSQSFVDPQKAKKLEDIKTIDDAITSLSNGRDMVQWLSKNASKKAYQHIAVRIAPLTNQNLTIKPVSYGQRGKIPVSMNNAQGVWVRSEDGKESMYLWQNAGKKSADEHTVMHELIHAATVVAVRRARAAENNSELSKAVKELDQLKDTIAKEFAKRTASKKLTDKEKSKAGQFAMSKTVNHPPPKTASDELVAWALTDKLTQDILKGIKVRPKKSAWNEFVSVVGKLLGMKPTDNHALSRLVEVTDKILTLSEMEQSQGGRIELAQSTQEGQRRLADDELEQIRTKIDPDSDKVPFRDKIVTEAKALANEGIGTATSNTLSKLRQGIVDKFEPLRKLDERLHGDNILHNSTLRGWVLVKSANSTQGALHAMLEYGRIRYNAREKIIETQGDNTGGLKSVLNKLNEINEASKAAEARLDNIKAAKKALLKARHTTETKKERNQIEKDILEADVQIKKEKKRASVKERFLSESDIEIGMLLNVQPRKDGTSREALFNEVLQEFNTYRADILKIAESTGVLSSEHRAMWEDQFYVPFYRVMGDSDQSGPHPSAGLSHQDIMKKLKGSERQLGDLLNNSLLNFHYLLNASLKNRAAFQALQNAEAVGIAQPTTEHKRAKEQSTYVMIDGQKQWYNVSDPVYLSALMSMGSMQLPDGFKQIAQVGGGIKMWFTKWTIAVPNFIIKNFFRDTLLTPALSSVGWSKGGALHGAKLWGLGEMNKIQADMLASGGAFEFGFNRDEVNSELEGSLRSKVVGVEQTLGMFGKAMNGYSQVQNLAENANLDKGKLVASFEAMDLMDFGADGSWSGIRLLNSLVPFLNATLQGLDKTARAAGTVFNARTASPETRAQAVRFAQVP